MDVENWKPRRGQTMSMMPPSAMRSAPETVWHYTDAAGLAGILSSHELWATAPYALNDTSEVLYGAELLRDVWRACDKTGLTDSQVSAMGFLADGLAERALERVFVISASENGDLLNQWAHYAGVGGFAVGIDTTTLTPMLSGGPRIDASTWSSWIQVTYEPDEQVRRMQEAVSFAIQWMPAQVRTGSVDAFSMSTVQEFALVHVMMAVKHPEFAAEKEVRFVTSSVANQPALLRPSGSRLVPYVKVDQRAAGVDSPRASAIKYVRIGPGGRAAEKRAIESLYRRPNEALAPAPEVFFSEIPYLARR